MAQNREKGGRVVFIGNIPYGKRTAVSLEYAHVATVTDLSQASVRNRSSKYSHASATSLASASSTIRRLANRKASGFSSTLMSTQLRQQCGI